MFVYLNTPSTQMLVNFDLVTKIIPRPKDGDPDNETWEVAMFHNDERRPHPTTGESVWVGTYEVIFEGSDVECKAYMQRLSNLLHSMTLEDYDT